MFAIPDTTPFLTMPVIGFGFACSVGVVLCAALVLDAWRKYLLRGRLPLPPGPRGLPLIGSALDLDRAYPWQTYEKWGKKYGGLVYANLLGNDFIIINSAKVAHDLLETRSSNYSDRPHIPANKIFGMDFNTGLTPYGNLWRLHRKIYNTFLSKKLSQQYKSIAISKSCQLVKNLLDAPNDYARHTQTFSIATIMATTYGYEVALKNDPFVTKIDHFIDLFLTALTTERAALFIAFPFMAHIPSWLPGGGFKKNAAECRALAREVLDGPVNYVKGNMAVGAAGKSLVRDLLEEGEKGRLDEDIIKAVATSTFLGGTETSDSMIRVFLLVMVLHPEAQDKAQAEIDRVVGTERLPDFCDRPDLPYVEAVYLECFRWRPVVPTALPHVTLRSDIYEGMYIPKGAIVIPNVWAMNHDETVFDNPMAFIPERHLTPAGSVKERTAHYGFGFGRRACVGRHIANQNVWAAIVTILATLRIAKARDESGSEIDVNGEFTGGLTSAPKPFHCSITPRSPRVEKLIRTWDEQGY